MDTLMDVSCTLTREFNVHSSRTEHRCHIKFCSVTLEITLPMEKSKDILYVGNQLKKKLKDFAVTSIELFN